MTLSHFREKTWWRKLLPGILILGFFVAPFEVSAQVSNFTKQVNYQARLTDTTNTAVADGTYNITFRLYTAPVSATTTNIWEETRTTTNRVQVTNGLFSVMLGSVTALTGVNWNQPLYLGVEIGATTTTPVWDGEMTPRKTIGTTPVAFIADTLDNLDSSQFVRTDATSTIATSSAQTLLTMNQLGAGNLLDVQQNSTSRFTVVNSGNVGIGTTSPYAKLSVVGEVAAAFFTATTTATSTFNGGFQVSSGSSGLYFTNGRMGIGTSTPLASLQINSAANTKIILGGNSSGSANITHATTSSQVGIFGGTDWNTGGAVYVTGNNYLDEGVAAAGAVQFTLGTASSEYQFMDNSISKIMILTNGGNLGIGTSTPTSRLQGAGSARPQLVLSDTGGGANAKHAYASSTLGAWAWGLLSDNLTTFTENMRLTTAGNLGLGTTSPYAKLSVVGEAVAQMFTATSTTATTTLAGGLNVNSGMITHDFTSGITSILNMELGASSFDTDAGILSWVDMPVTSSATFGTKESYSAQIDGNPLLTVYSESNGAGSIRNPGIGVGSTSPWATLSVTGSTLSSSTMPLAAFASSSGVVQFFIDSIGNVGIGTSSPYAKLSVVGEVVSAFFTATSTTATSTFAGSIGFGTSSPFGVPSGSFVVGTSSPLFMMNGNSGNIGIGTTSPSAKLHIGSAAQGGNVRIANGWLCVDDNDTCTGASTAGTVYAVGVYTTGADIAEQYPTNDTTLVAGEIVAIEGTQPAYVVRATSSRMTFGIISTQPGMLLAGYNKGSSTALMSVPVALAGRVPVKVSLENGPIVAGDRITISSTPGVGMKASVSSPVTVAIALSDWSGNPGVLDTAQTGTVLGFVSTAYRELSKNISGEEFSLTSKLTDTVVSLFGLSSDESDVRYLANRPLHFGGQTLTNMRALFSETGKWSLDENGKLSVEEIHTKRINVAEQICIQDVCVNRDQLSALLQNSGLGGGSGSGSTPPPAPAPDPTPPPSDETPPTPPDETLAPPPEESETPVPTDESEGESTSPPEPSPTPPPEVSSPEEPPPTLSEMTP